MKQCPGCEELRYQIDVWFKTGLVILCIAGLIGITCFFYYQGKEAGVYAACHTADIMNVNNGHFTFDPRLCIKRSADW